MNLHWFRKLFKRNRPKIPDLLWRACIARLPFLQHLSQNELVRLRNHTESLLATLPMRGAGGFELSNKIAVLIAIQAAFLVLNLTLDLYRDIAAVIVYPTGFIVTRKETDRAGIVHEWREPLAGEAIQDGGAIVLSWEDVENISAHHLGRNVVIHEFAHKIDMKRSTANGYPPFLAAYHQGIVPREWQEVFSRAFEDFNFRVEAADRQWQNDFEYDGWHAPLPMDAYAATNAAEFFAVASEAFFIHPRPLAAAYPDVYRLLSLYYQQDPLGRISMTPVPGQARS